MGNLRNIAGRKEFTPRIGRLIWQMDDVRRQVLRAVEGLSAAQLSWHPDPRCESIGTLLLHIAAVERSWIGEDIMRRPMEPEEWNAAFAIRLNQPQIEGQPLEYFLAVLKREREQCYTDLCGFTDADLDRAITPLDPGDPANAENQFTMEWILYHVMEHEAHHKGQIALMKRLLPV